MTTTSGLRCWPPQRVESGKYGSRNLLKNQNPPLQTEKRSLATPAYAGSLRMIGLPFRAEKKSLAGVGEFAGGVALLQGFGLAVFEDELVDYVGEARRAELEALDGDELLRRCAGKFEG
jgi:hypothetical protein